MKKEKCWRHGDVIVKAIKSLPAEAVEQKVETVVLAEGEVTGHSHRISEGAAKLFKFDDKVYMRVTSERAALVHEEHKRINLPTGDYEVIIQKDYEPSGWKQVRD